MSRVYIVVYGINISSVRGMSSCPKETMGVIKLHGDWPNPTL